MRTNRLWKPADRIQESFKITAFANPKTGSQSWRVSGSRRDGSRIRENFSDPIAAQSRKVALATEALGQLTDTSLRATKLTETQLRLAEVAFVRLGEEQDLLPAVENWVKVGKQQSVAESPRLDEAASAFLAWLKQTESIRPRTKGKYRLRIQMFTNSVQNLRLDGFTHEIIEKFLNAREVSALTKVGDRQAVSRFFSWCIERPRRWLAMNPCREIRIEKKADRTPPQILSVEECRKLLTAAKKYRRGQLVPYVAVCLFGGLRPAEAERLTWDKVNLQDKEIRVEAQSTKTKRPRVVAIGDTLKVWLEGYKGKPFRPPNIRRGLDTIKPAAGYTGRVADPKSDGLKPWPSDVLRHTAASHFFRKTGSYGETAEQLGNSEAIIKAHYQGRVSSEETEKFYAILPATTKTNIVQMPAQEVA